MGAPADLFQSSISRNFGIDTQLQPSCLFGGFLGCHFFKLQMSWQLQFRKDLLSQKGNEVSSNTRSPSVVVQDRCRGMPHLFLSGSR